MTSCLSIAMSKVVSMNKIQCVWCEPDGGCYICNGTKVLDGELELDILLPELDYPKDKRDDLPWLYKNLGVKNMEKKAYGYVMAVIGQLLKQ